MKTTSKPKVWRVTLRYEAEETVYVTGDTNWAARLAAQGEEEYGEILGVNEPEMAGPYRVKKATSLKAADVPDWVKTQNGDLFGESA